MDRVRDAVMSCHWYDRLGRCPNYDSGGIVIKCTGHDACQITWVIVSHTDDTMKAWQLGLTHATLER
jgi:hypothetical protein